MFNLDAVGGGTKVSGKLWDNVKAEESWAVEDIQGDDPRRVFQL